MGTEPTDEQVRGACKLIWGESLSVKDACTKAGMKPPQIRAFLAASSGESPARADWQEWLEFAIAEARAYWQAKAREYAENKNATGAKVALEQLKALEPERYKKDESRQGAPVQVILYQRQQKAAERIEPGEKIIEISEIRELEEADGEG